MGATTPQSTIKLYNAPLINTRAGKTLLFESAADREAYFESKLVASSVNCTVVKKRYNTIKVKTSMATLETCNYLSFINPSYGNKLFYAYIMNTDYLNNEVSLVTYNIDWWMTDMFNVQFNDNTQMVREHLTNSEYELLKGEHATEYPDVDKMFTPEPLNYDVATEKRIYDIAGDNIGYLNRIGTLGQGTATAWNATTNNGKVFLESGETFSNTDHVPSNMIHVLSFTIPRWDYSPGHYEEGMFRENLAPLLTAVINARSNTSPAWYYPFFIYDPTGQTGLDSTVLPSPSYYFVGRHTYGEQVASHRSTSNTMLEDTEYARPYMMVGCEDMDAIQAIIDYLNSTGNVSSILGFHEMPIALLDEFFYSANPNHLDPSITNASSSLTIPTPKYLTDVKSAGDVDPKLHYFPYSYFTFEGVNNSSRMELKYELTRGYTHGVKLWKGVTVNSTGTYFYVRPEKYRGVITDSVGDMDNDTRNEELDYTMVYSDYPEVPYNTDAYAAFIANKTKAIMEENTREGLYGRAADYTSLQTQSITSKLGAFGNVIGAIGSAVTGNVGGAISGASSAIGSVGSSMAADLRIQSMDVKSQMMDAATDTLLNPLAGTEENPIYDNFSQSRAAYVMPNYHPGSSGGIINLTGSAQRTGIIVRAVTRSRDFLIKYSNFFKRFGYATVDVKKPAICKYMESPANNAAAHFEEGGTSHIYLSQPFYTETKNMKVDNVCADSAIFIEHLFNSGLSVQRWKPTSNN